MRFFKFLSGLNVLAGIIFIMTPFILFPVCENLKPDGTHMGCYYSGVLFLCAGIVITFCEVLNFFKGFNNLRSLISITSGILSATISNKVITIWKFGLCADKSHPCNTTIKIILILALVISISNFILYIKYFLLSDNRK